MDLQDTMCPSIDSANTADARTQVLLRFGNFLLACVLYGFQLGDAISDEAANLCQMASHCGFAFYFALELVADRRAREEKSSQEDLRIRVNLADQQLANRLTAEQKMVRIRERERQRQR